jgi:hypothetical protein
MEGGNGNEQETKEKRQLSRVNVQTTSHLHGMDPVGYGQALLETTGKGKSFGVLARATVYTMYISGWSFVYGFYPSAVQKFVIEVLKNLNDPRFKRSAKPSNH